MNLNEFDLNLLKTLRVLLQEKNTAKAAERLGVSQPAVSRSLAKIRESFDDPLFVRQARGLKLTDKAQTLAQQLPKILALLETTLQGEHFCPDQLTGKFRLAINGYLLDSHGYAICAAIMAKAPELALELHSYSPATDGQLLTGEVDAGISFYPIEVSKELRQVHIATSHIGGIYHHCHPLGELGSISVNELLNYPLAGLIVPEYNAQYMKMQNLFENNIQLNPKFRSQQLSTILQYLNEQPDTICIAPESAFVGLDQSAFKFVRFEHKQQPMTIEYSLNFNNNYFKSAKFLWLEREIKQVFKQLGNTQRAKP
ncbi:LysR family transcriptional regulator [Motilimonas pumila]|uniref:LysR family transcriptional regulator n=1 Tax=Motilimonas pumila TaxID=2303987 RepID=A0A418YGD0_9GAMM|nr:LysR family transcriptional regulator [Motilimonas pumila]RJG48705.1 LysR family transcriptional regulator [Motilimonas pumila]